MEVVLRDDEATAEQHVGHWAVHHQVPDGHEDKQGSEVHAVTDGTQQNGRRQDREHGLEREEDAVGDGAKQVVSHVVHEAERLRLANEVGVASSIAERQGEAKDGPQERDNSQRHQAHSDAANHVLVGDHAAVEEGNARNHDEHQGRARHHEGLVAAVRGCGRGRLVDDAVARRADAHGHRDADNCRQKQEDKRLLLPYCLVVEHRLAHRARSGEVAHGVSSSEGDRHDMTREREEHLLSLPQPRAWHEANPRWGGMRESAGTYRRDHPIRKQPARAARSIARRDSERRIFTTALRLLRLSAAARAAPICCARRNEAGHRGWRARRASTRGPWCMRCAGRRQRCAAASAQRASAQDGTTRALTTSDGDALLHLTASTCGAHTWGRFGVYCDLARTCGSRTVPNLADPCLAQPLQQRHDVCPATGGLRRPCVSTARGLSRRSQGPSPVQTDRPFQIADGGEKSSLSQVHGNGARPSANGERPLFANALVPERRRDRRCGRGLGQSASAAE
eukprot:364933-Chlamydomonas_euryale.AAC.19